MSLTEPGPVQAVADALATQGYLADRPLAIAVHLALTLAQPLLLEGEAGVGKTTRGMRAAMPHADLLLAGNSLASLEELADILEEM